MLGKMGVIIFFRAFFGLVSNNDKKGRIAFDTLIYLILGLVALAISVFMILDFSRSGQGAILYIKDLFRWR